MSQRRFRSRGEYDDRVPGTGDDDGYFRPHRQASPPRQRRQREPPESPATISSQPANIYDEDDYSRQETRKHTNRRVLETRYSEPEELDYTATSRHGPSANRRGDPYRDEASTTRTFDGSRSRRPVEAEVFMDATPQRFDEYDAVPAESGSSSVRHSSLDRRRRDDAVAGVTKDRYQEETVIERTTISSTNVASKSDPPTREGSYIASPKKRRSTLDDRSHLVRSPTGEVEVFRAVGPSPKRSDSSRRREELERPKKGDVPPSNLADQLEDLIRALRRTQGDAFSLIERNKQRVFDIAEQAREEKRKRIAAEEEAKRQQELLQAHRSVSAASSVTSERIVHVVHHHRYSSNDKDAQLSQSDLEREAMHYVRSNDEDNRAAQHRSVSEQPHERRRTATPPAEPAPAPTQPATQDSAERSYLTTHTIEASPQRRRRANTVTAQPTQKTHPPQRRTAKTTEDAVNGHAARHQRSGKPPSVTSATKSDAPSLVGHHVTAVRSHDDGGPPPPKSRPQRARASTII